MNVENAEKLAAYLDTVPPEQFDMSTWCGTAFCIAGHVNVLTNHDPEKHHEEKSAWPAKWLGLDDGQRYDLFLRVNHGEPWRELFEHGTVKYESITPQQAARAVRRAIELWGQS